MASVNETKEVIAAALAILAAARKVSSDGWQITDAGLIISDAILREAVLKALDGADKIVVEMSKLDIFATMDLATYVLSVLPKALGAK